MKTKVLNFNCKTKLPCNNVGANISQTTNMEEMLHKIAAQTKSMAKNCYRKFLRKNLRDDVVQITGMAEMPNKTS